MKIRKKLRLKTRREKHLKIITIPDPPEPQKVWFRLDETHGFTNTAYPLKVTTKSHPHGSRNEPKMTPKAPRDAPETLKTVKEKHDVKS